MKIISYDCETGIETLRDATEEESLALEAEVERDRLAKEAEEQKAVAKKALLEKLGITDEEAKLLLS